MKPTVLQAEDRRLAWSGLPEMLLRFNARETKFWRYWCLNIVAYNFMPAARFSCFARLRGLGLSKDSWYNLVKRPIYCGLKSSVGDLYVGNTHSRDKSCARRRSWKMSYRWVVRCFAWLVVWSKTLWMAGRRRGCTDRSVDGLRRELRLCLPERVYSTSSKRYILYPVFSPRTISGLDVLNLKREKRVEVILSR